MEYQEDNKETIRLYFFITALDNQTAEMLPPVFFYPGPSVLSKAKEALQEFL